MSHACAEPGAAQFRRWGASAGMRRLRAACGSFYGRRLAPRGTRPTWRRHGRRCPAPTRGA